MSYYKSKIQNPKSKIQIVHVVSTNLALIEIKNLPNLETSPQDKSKSKPQPAKRAVNGLGFGILDLDNNVLTNYSPVGVKIPKRNFKLFGIS